MWGGGLNGDGIWWEKAKAEDLAGDTYRFAGNGGSGSDGDDKFGRRREL